MLFKNFDNPFEVRITRNLRAFFIQKKPVTIKTLRFYSFWIINPFLTKILIKINFLTKISKMILASIALRLSGWLSVWTMMLDTLASCALLLRETATFMISLAITRWFPRARWNGLDFDVVKVSNKLSCIVFWRRGSVLHKLCTATTVDMLYNTIW